MVWVVSLLTANIIARGLTPEAKAHGIRSLIGPGSRVDPQVHSVALPPCTDPRGQSQNCFGENEISPVMIAL